MDSQIFKVNLFSIFWYRNNYPEPAILHIKSVWSNDIAIVLFIFLSISTVWFVRSTEVAVFFLYNYKFYRKYYVSFEMKRSILRQHKNMDKKKVIKSFWFSWVECLDLFLFLPKEHISITEPPYAWLSYYITTQLNVKCFC